MEDKFPSTLMHVIFNVWGIKITWRRHFSWTWLFT